MDELLERDKDVGETFLPRDDTFNGDSPEESGRELHDPFVQQYFVMTFCIDLAALLVNSLLMAVIICNDKLRTVTDGLIFNLTIANILPFFHTVIYVVEIITGIPVSMDTAGCALFNALTIEILFGPTVFVMLLCVDMLVGDRWEKITFRKLPPSLVALILSAAGWIIVISLITPYILFAGISLERQGTWSCVLRWQQLFYYEIITAFGIPFPFIVLSILAYILLLVFCSDSNYESVMDDDPHSTRNLGNLCTAIAAISLTCKTPHFIWTIFLELGRVPSYITTMVVAALLHMSGVIPPCMCLLLNENYRPSFWLRANDSNEEMQLTDS